MPIWLTLMRIEFATPSLIPRSRIVDIGDEDVVADQLPAAPSLSRQQSPSRPIVLGHAVLDRQDRIGVGELGEIFDLLLDRTRLALAGIDICAVLEKFGGRGSSAERDLRRQA